MTDTQAEVREKIKAAIMSHMYAIDKDWLEGEDLAADAILALLPPAPAVGEALEQIRENSAKHMSPGDLDRGDLAYAHRATWEIARKALAALGGGGVSPGL